MTALELASLTVFRVGLLVLVAAFEASLFFAVVRFSFLLLEHC